ncbi:MAG: hypothetical protein M1821_003913 [Bathelium mastoideum]|nr:MAG: hypothetical protein M1821_003913 [Bathelium mastoideum]
MSLDPPIHNAAGNPLHGLPQFLYSYHARGDFQSRLMAQNYNVPPASIPQSPSRFPAPARGPAPTLSTYPQRTNETASLPALTNGASSQADSSLCTDDASSVLGPTRNFLETDQDGALRNDVPEQRQRTVFPCCFYFLRCVYYFYDMEEWKTHCLSHFHRHEPPATVRCPYCDAFGPRRYNSGPIAWEERMRHIAEHHIQEGLVQRRPRPDFDLFLHLWQRRIINDAQYVELKGNHILSDAPAPYTVTQGLQADERRRSEQRRQIRRGDRSAGNQAPPRTSRE